MGSTFCPHDHMADWELPSISTVSYNILLVQEKITIQNGVSTEGISFLHHHKVKNHKLDFKYDYNFMYSIHLHLLITCYTPFA